MSTLPDTQARASMGEVLATLTDYYHYYSTRYGWCAATDATPMESIAPARVVRRKRPNVVGAAHNDGYASPTRRPNRMFPAAPKKSNLKIPPGVQPWSESGLSAVFPFGAWHGMALVTLLIVVEMSHEPF